MRNCIICGATNNIEKHHVFGGTANRKISEKYGFTVDLCSYHHRDGKAGVHFNKELATSLKINAQEIFEIKHSREEWMALIGRNYI